jgi:hypothetical protein
MQGERSGFGHSKFQKHWGEQDIELGSTLLFLFTPFMEVHPQSLWVAESPACVPPPHPSLSLTIWKGMSAFGPVFPAPHTVHLQEWC